MKASTIEIIEAVAVCVWLMSPVLLAFLMDRPPRKEKPPRRCAGVRLANVNH